jgi:hypothetical protein
MHLRLSPEERCQLTRVAARLGLSPSAAIRHLVHIEDERGAAEVSLETMFRYGAHLWRD